MKNYFMLTEDHGMLRDLAGELAQQELRPRSEAVDHQAQVPEEGMAVFAEAGLVCCGVPEEYGGAGLDGWSQTAVIEEAAKECASTAWAMAQAAAVADCVLACGTKAQQEQLLPQLVQGGLAAVCLNGIRAERSQGGYVLSGTGRHVHLAGNCTCYLIRAMLDGRVIWVLLDAGVQGIAVEAEAQKLGLKGCPAGTLQLAGCEVTEDALLTGEVEAKLQATLALYGAAVSAGVAQGALREAVDYVNQRVQFGKTIAQFENTQQVMAELQAKTEAARTLVWEAARAKDAGMDYDTMAAMAKVVAGDTASVVTRKCVQFMGGYGYSREYPVERKMRDAKMMELVGGTSEFLKAFVAQTEVLA